MDAVYVYSRGSRVTLTLQPTCLVISGQHLGSARSTGVLSACIQGDADSSGSDFVDYFRVVYAAVAGATLTLDVCELSPPEAKKRTARLGSVQFSVDAGDVDSVAAWTGRLLDRAYAQANTKLHKRLLVLVNPFGGQGRARTLYETHARPVLRAARCEIVEMDTRYRNHAEEIMRTQFELGRYDAVLCCSGDGIPHEVFNGLGRRPDAALALASTPVFQLPCGSGNAMCVNLVGSNDVALAALTAVKGVVTPLDLCSVTQGANRALSFLSQTLGMIADCDLGTEHLRWMGEARFTFGVVQRIITKATYPCTVSFKAVRTARPDVLEAYRAGSAAEAELPPLPAAGALPDLAFGTVADPVPADWTTLQLDTMAIFYVGNMAWMSSDANFFPAALPSDALMDMVVVDGKVSRRAAVEIMLGVEDGKHFEHPDLTYYKLAAYRITPRAPKGYISIDGEAFDFSPFQVEVHRGIGRVLSRDGRYQTTALDR
ncbi:ATP-NAD kinase-like domain-containing protein [Dipodascopsis tothii]|uniref:ATP-NAD kinase-like domain-containing protein n=1 Tax=Dipodascopsis tothii TaxID=44089 RepID=UPI0034CE8EAA